MLLNRIFFAERRGSFFSPLLALTIFFLFAPCSAAFGQAAPRFEPDPRLDAEIFGTPRIPAQKFARAALVAGGSNEAETENLLAALEEAWGGLSPRLLSPDSAEEKAETILSFLYERFLSKYNFDQTLVGEAMKTGVYNCVSSALLFMYFAKRADIPVLAVETPRHAFCVILDGERKIDVETTNPYGVNPGKKRSESLSNGRTQYITVPAKDYAGRRQVDDRRAVGMVYNNRISQLQKKKRDAETVGLAVDAYEVQGRSDLSRRDLQVCVGNAAAALSRKGDDQGAVGLLEAAEEKFGKCENWTKRIYDGYHNLVLEKVKALPYEEGLAAADRYKGDLREKDYAELKEFAYLLGAQKASQKHDWPRAIQISDEGLSEFPQSKKILSNRNIYAQNYAVDFHNAAASLFNAGKKDEAVQKVREGLEIIPGNKTLLNDLAKMSAR